NKNKALFFPHWSKTNFKTIKDIWEVNQQRFISGQIVFNQLTKKINWITEFEIIKKSIPKPWILLLKNNIPEKIKLEKIEDSTKLSISHNRIFKNGIEIEPIKLKTKDIYFHCLYPCEYPKYINVWKGLFESFNWKCVCKQIANPLLCNKKKQFHWKTVHRSLYCESRLASMGKSDGICKLCTNEQEDIIHMLLDCRLISNVWLKVTLMINELLDTDIVLDNYMKMFGVYIRDLKEKNYIVNMILFETKWQIWKNRNCVRYGNKKSENTDTIFSYIKKGIKDDLILYKHKDSKLRNKLDIIINDIINAC
ncbi:MAG: zinc-binding domain-containing protein, partial [Desulfobulbaceae bacterium]|nr:zinc-binding domain-containing protein [Desulfobulbaceae bacterium]